MIGWICLFPLVAAEVELGQIEQAVEHVRIMLGPTQQPLPASVDAALKAALQAWDDKNTETAREHLAEASDLAGAWGYV